MNDHGNAGYDDLLEAIEAGEGYFLSCPNGHAMLPPRRVCPHCGSRELERTPLSETGELSTYTIVDVPTPGFRDDAPYVTAIATFGEVRLTGVLRGVELEDVETGQSVTVDVEPNETSGERTLTFRPA